MTTTTAERAVLYARISLDRSGEEIGIQRQLHDLRQLAQQRGWEVVDEFADNDISATKGMERKGYDRVWELVTSGRVDHVLVWQSSRLMRSRQDRAAVIETFGAHNVGVTAFKGPSFDLRNAYGRFAADIMSSQDTVESEVKSERVAAAIAHLKRSGKSWGLVPYGWDRVGRGLTVEQPVNAHEAAIVVELVERLLAGESLNALYRDMNLRGEPAPGWVTWMKRTPDARAASQRKARQKAVTRGEDPDEVTAEPTKLWAKSTIRTLVARDANAGIRERREDGTTLAGAWAPIVDLQQHERLRALLAGSTITVTRQGRSWDQERRSHSGPRPGARKYLLTNGIGRCGVCGDLLRTAKRTGSNTTQIIYTCRGVGCVGRVLESVDRFATAVVMERLSRPDALDWLVGDDIEAGRLDQRCEVLQRQLDEATDLFIGRKITGGQMERITAGITPELEAVRRERDSAVRGLDIDTLRPLAGPEAFSRWEGMSVSARRAVLETLGVEVTLLRREKHGPGFESETVRVTFKQDSALDPSPPPGDERPGLVAEEDSTSV